MRPKQIGGNKPIGVNPNTLNRFIDPQMEQYMNPVYGLILCETGYMPNLYFLNKSKLLDSFSKNYSKDEHIQTILKNHAKIISESCTEEPFLKIIKPTKHFMQSRLSPIDIGRHIAVKYVNKLAKTDPEKIQPISVRNEHQKITINPKYARDIKKTKDIIESFTFNKFVKIENNDIFAFHIILFCLWWKADNQNGINEYYKGIQEVFDVFNQTYPNNKPLHIRSGSSKTGIYTDRERGTAKSFEQLVLEITQVEFNIYNQEYSSHFCEGMSKNTFPDCGETTARNIINILCFDKEKNKFDLKILEEKGAIPELIEYYKTFNDFPSQSTPGTSDIFGMKLNARNAWSKLIIDHAKTNIEFKEKCFNGNYEYEIRSGLSKDDTKLNLLQLFNNLFENVEEWEDLMNGEDDDDDEDGKKGSGNITMIDEIVNENGFGKIIIQNSSGLEFTVHLKDGHYYVDLISEKDEIVYSYLPKPQKDILDILLKKNINETNYVQMNFSSEELVNNYFLNDDIEIKYGLFKLTMTDYYDSDTRRRMILDVTNVPFFEKITTEYGIDPKSETKYVINPKINDYTFKIFIDNFDFIKKFPGLKVLNLSHHKQNTDSIKTIDLSPLEEIEEIGNYFLSSYSELTTINLSHLKNVCKIGDSFLNNCNNAHIVGLSSLTKLEKIGNNFILRNNVIKDVDLSKSPIVSIGEFFLNECTNLETVKLNKTIISIDENFLNDCRNLKHIDLRCLENVEVIGEAFICNCEKLRTVILPEKFNKLKFIDNYFINDSQYLDYISKSTHEFPDLESVLKSTKLKKNDLSCFSNIENIGNNFLEGCVNIDNIDLSALSNLSIIGNGFLSGCEILQEILFNDDAKIFSVGNLFLSGCGELKQVNLKCLQYVDTINDYFMTECKNLVNVEFPNKFQNVTEIKNNFMIGAKILKKINFSCFSNVMEIGSKFLFGSGLETADLSSLRNLTKIDKDFMANCFRLRSIIFPPKFKMDKNILHLIGIIKESPTSPSKTASKTKTSSKTTEAKTNANCVGKSNSTCTIMGGKKRRISMRNIKQKHINNTRKITNLRKFTRKTHK